MNGMREKAQSMRKVSDAMIIGEVLACGVVLSLFVLLPLLRHRYYYLGQDAIGYFGISATMAGKDWSEVLATVDSFYYGYALLLVPGFWLQKKAGDVLIYAAFVNAVLLVLGFVFAYKCFCHFCDKQKSVICALCVSLYSGSICSSQYYGADLLVLFVFWFLCYCLIRFVETYMFRYEIIMAILGAFIVGAHKRAVVVTIAIMVLFFVLLLDRKIDIKVFGVYFLIQLMLLAVACWAHSQYSELFAQVVGKVDVNSVSARWTFFLGEVLTGEFWIRTIKNILRQFLYISVATLNVAMFPIFIGIRRIINFFERRGEERNTISYLEIFITVVLILQILVVTITLKPTRVDMLGMGRYIDYILPVLVMLFFIEIINDNKVFNKHIVKYLIIMLIINIIGAVCFRIDYVKFPPGPYSGQGNYVGEAWIVDFDIPWSKICVLLLAAGCYVRYAAGVRHTIRKGIGLILLTSYFLFCYGAASQKIHDTPVEKERDYAILAEAIESNDVTHIYWPYMSYSSEMRHFQVYCANSQFHCYLSDTADYEGNEESIFDRLQEVLERSTGAAYFVTESILEKIAEEHSVDVIGNLNNLYMVRIN